MTNAIFTGKIITLNVLIKREKQSNKLYNFGKTIKSKGKQNILIGSSIHNLRTGTCTRSGGRAHSRKSK